MSSEEMLVKKYNELANELLEERNSLKEQVQLLQNQLKQKQKLLEEMAQECDAMRSQLHKPKEYKLVDVVVYEGVVIQIYNSGILFKYVAKNEKFHCENEGISLKDNAVALAKVDIDSNKFQIIKAFLYKDFTVEIESRKSRDCFKFVGRSDDGYSEVCSGYSEIRTLEEAELQAKEIIDDLIKRQHEDDLLEADLAAEY